MAVRAGAVTPTIEDENHFRNRMGLPPISADARRAWAEDKNVRRPITLVQPGTTAKKPAPAAEPE